VLAVELLCAAQALELRGAGGTGASGGRGPLRPSPETEAALARLRADIPPLPVDRFLSPDLQAAERLVWSGELLPDWLE
jgi:histidine ammonia-lyase